MSFPLPKVSGDSSVTKFNVQDEHYERPSKLIEFVLLSTAFHPFAASREDETVAVERYGWMRRKWMKVSIVITIYLTIKPFIIIALGLLRKSVRDVDSIRNIDHFLGSIGDPYSSLPFASWLTYMIPPTGALWIRCYLPIYFRHCQPFDCSFARFMLEPEREVRQFDVAASEMLRLAIEAFEHDRWKLSYSTKFKLNIFLGRKILLSELERAQWQLNEMKKVRQQIHLIRPESLKPDWRRRSFKNFSFQSVSMTTSNFVFGSLLMLSWTWDAWIERCEKLLTAVKYEQIPANPPDCRPQDVFGLADFLTMFEANLVILLGFAVSSTVVIVLHLFQVAHQVYLTESTKKRLVRLAGELRNCDFRGQTEVRGLSSYLTASLCGTIVGLRMFDRESRKCVRSLGHAARFSIVLCLMYTAVVFASLAHQASLDRANYSAAAASGLKRAKAIVFMSWLVIFMNQNVILLSCAMIPSRIGHLDRKVYSVMAQLVRVQTSLRSSDYLERLLAIDANFPIDDPLTSLWRRFTLSSDFKKNRPADRAFNTEITYKGTQHQFLYRQCNFFAPHTYQIVDLLLFAHNSPYEFAGVSSHHHSDASVEFSLVYDRSIFLT